MQKHAVPLILATIFMAMSLWAGISPSDREVWYAESLPLFVVFLILVLTYKKFKFSNTAYILMSVWLILHTIGAKYTFANVPFEWGNEFLMPILRIWRD